MKCPSCQSPIDHEASSCCSCDFSSDLALRQFGGNKVHLNRLHDAADCLGPKDIRQLSSQLDRMESRFPQLNFAIYYGELNASISLSELSFWLLNQSRIGGDFEVDNDSTVLLIVDLETRQAGIALGYQTELLLSEQDCNRSLTAGRDAFLDQDFTTGTQLILKQLEKCLVSRARLLKSISRDEQMLAHHQPQISESTLPTSHAQQNSAELILVEN